jgi:hypothetical protein
MDIVGWLNNFPIKYHIFISILVTLIIGYVDYLTGLEFRMEIFYLAPILYVTWFVDKKSGILLSAISLITILCSDILAGKNYELSFIEIWNSAMYLAFFVVATLLLSRLKSTLLLRAGLIADLERALSEVKELTGILPICANCKKIRDDEGYWHDVAVYIRDHTNAEFTHSLCKACAEKLYPELYNKK